MRMRRRLPRLAHLPVLGIGFHIVNERAIEVEGCTALHDVMLVFLSNMINRYLPKVLEYVLLCVVLVLVLERASLVSRFLRWHMHAIVEKKEGIGTIQQMAICSQRLAVLDSVHSLVSCLQREVLE